VLGAVAPLALAASAGTALVVDLDPAGPPYAGSGSLAALVRDEPRRDDLTPTRSGVAVLRNGGIEPEAAEEVLHALTRNWPAVVFRLPAHHRGGDGAVPVLPLVAGGLFRQRTPRAIYQRSGGRVDQPGPGVALPPPRRSTLAALLTGRSPMPGDRWIRAWSRVWNHPWG
jgi:hypothetical protein